MPSNAAAQMQQQITDAPRSCKVDGQTVAIRIGCHFGPVVLENRDVFGATVHTANRMTSQAKAGQIITTAATVERLSPGVARLGAPDRPRDAVKGQGAEVTLYEALWQTEDITSMLPAITMGGRADKRAVRLRLRCRTANWCSMRRGRTIAIGRADDNDVIIKGNLISRIHARIEISRAASSC